MPTVPVTVVFPLPHTLVAVSPVGTAGAGLMETLPLLEFTAWAVPQPPQAEYGLR